MLKHTLLALVVGVGLLTGLAYAEEPQHEMTTYQFVLLHRAPDAPSLDGGGDLRGAMVPDVGSVEAAREIS